MTSSSLRYRQKEAFARMGKTYGDQLKDASTIGLSYEKLCDMNPTPLNGNHKRPAKLNCVKDEMEVHDNCNTIKRHKLNKIEMVPTTMFKSNNYILSEENFNKKSPNDDKFDLNVSPPDSSEDNEPYNQRDLSSPSLQKSHHRLTTKSELGLGSQLILMSCLACYLHVMVCDANPKCPKCFKGDCLVDMFHESPTENI
ncbi:hypothetical protein LXL04_022163 [Taraxacum kok-saghyz]